MALVCSMPLMPSLNTDALWPQKMQTYFHSLSYAPSYPCLCIPGHIRLTTFASHTTYTVSLWDLQNLSPFPISTRASMGQTLMVYWRNPPVRSLPPGPCSKQTCPTLGFQVNPPKMTHSHFLESSFSIALSYLSFARIWIYCFLPKFTFNIPRYKWPILIDLVMNILLKSKYQSLKVFKNVPYNTCFYNKDLIPFL